MVLLWGSEDNFVGCVLIYGHLGFREPALLQPGRSFRL